MKSVFILNFGKYQRSLLKTLYGLKNLNDDDLMIYLQSRILNMINGFQSIIIILNNLFTFVLAYKIQQKTSSEVTNEFNQVFN